MHIRIHFAIIFLLFIFSTLAYAQNIRILSPKGGENWSSDAEHEITWKSEDISNIKIEYSTDSGINWNAISNSFPAFVGNYSWYVPQINSGYVLLRIININNYSIYDTGSFTLIPPSANDQKFLNTNPKSPLATTSLTLTSPNPTSDGGIVWEVGTTKNITWSYAGDAPTITIEYSKNGGANWSTLVSGLSGVTSYQFPWNSTTNTPTTEALIRITGGGFTKTSNHYFYIKNTTLLSSGTTIKILPFGNSITFGTNKDLPTVGNTGDRRGYEYMLWNLLRQNDYNFDLIGSEFSGYHFFPDYQNGGFPGAKTPEILSVLQNGTNTKFTTPDIITDGPYLNFYPANIILIHSGTNDISGGTIDTSAIGQMMDYIHSDYPNTWMVVAKILRSDNTDSTTYRIYNTQLEAGARKRINAGYKILIVDMYNIPGFDYTTGGDLSDDRHPNYSGYDKMGQVWFDAVQLLLPTVSAAPPNFSQSSIDTVAYVGIPFNYQAVASGTGLITYSVTSPADSIYRYVGKVSWTPTSVGEVSMTITASNGTSPNAVQNLTIHVLQQPSLLSSLVSYWRFDENKSSGPFTDKYNTNNGYTENSLTYTSGQANGAYTFDGTDKVNILDEPAFDFQTSSFSVEAWINLSSSGPAKNRAVVGKYGRSAPYDENLWWLGVDGSNKPTFFISFYNSGTRTPIQVTSSTAISTNTWVHIVGVKNGSTNLQLYVNGSLAGTATTGSSVSNNNFNSTRPLNIGHWYNDKLFYGSIDEVAIYNGVLGSSTISSQYSRGVTYHEGYFDIHSSVMAFLQGPYSSGSMSTTLNSDGYLPLSQPYNTSPWNYFGNENVSSIPSGVVDWVLLELRSIYNGAAVSRRAGFVKSDGTIVDIDGTSSLDFSGILPGNYYIVVKHRNHLAIMSDTAVSLPNSSAHDFTTNSTSAYGTNPMATLNDGRLGMYAGDANADGQITSTDFNVFNPKFYNALTGYDIADWNLDGQITSSDFNLFSPNFYQARVTRVP